jgi:hypothetical protein
MDNSVESRNPQAADGSIDWRKRLWIAFAIGFSFSVLIAVLEALRHSVVWMILQLPGLVLGEAIWGLDSGGNQFEIVMVVANGFLYSICILIVLAIAQLIHEFRKKT